MIICDRCKTNSDTELHKRQRLNENYVDLCAECYDVYNQGLECIEDEIYRLKDQRISQWGNEFLRNYPKQK